MAAGQGEAEQALFTAGIADHMPGLIGYWDANLLCRFANQAYLDWFGLTPAKLIGMSIRDLLGKDLFARNEDYIRGALAGQRQSFERTLTKPSGEIGHTWAQYIPDIADDGLVRGFFVLVTDVTELRRTTDALKAANADLEVARKEAEAANEAKSYFLANMSHEIRTPLTSIVGFSKLLSDETIGPKEVAEYAGQIASASQGLLLLVDDILDHTKLDAGRIDLNLLPCDIAAISDDVAEMMRVQVATKTVEISVERIGFVPGNLMLDEFRIRQVLQNLVSNAVKFTQHGAIKIAIEYKPETSTAHVSVQDTGIGISDEGQKLLFQRFSQLDQNSGNRQPGTGLGLMICRQLIRLMGGEIYCESQLGVGSTFRFEIPAAECVYEKDFNIVASQKPSRSGHVLIVEAHKASRQFLTSILENAGQEVTVVESGENAVKLATNTQFDLIFMDVNIPGVGAITAIKDIRTVSELNATSPIIVLSAMGDDCLASYLSVGADDFVRKPLHPAAVVQSIRRWLRH